MAIAFRIEERRLGNGSAVVAVVGEIDLFTAPEFKLAVQAAINGGHDRVIIDLSEVTFIDSSSLGVLIGAHRRLKARHGTMTVVTANEAILKTFQITGLDGVFEIAPSLADVLDGAPA